MCIDPNPLVHQLHLKELEAKYLARNFDHSKPALTGWRAERQMVEFAHQNRETTATVDIKTNQSGLARKWFAMLWGYWLKTPLVD